MNENTKSHIQEADALLRQGNLPAAHFSLKKALREEPDNTYALTLNAELQVRRGEQTDSEDTVSRLFDLDPASFNSMLQKRLGHICFANELFSRASQLFEWVREQKAQDELSLYHSGICLRRLGQMDIAEQRLLECIKLRPSVAAPYLQLGHVYKATGRTDLAADQYKKYIGLSEKEKGLGYWSLADLKSYKFRNSEITKIKRELELRQNDLPQLSALYFARGWAAEQKKNYAAAMMYYKKANALQAKLKPFNSKQYRQIVSALRTVPAEKNPTSSNEPPVAILIVGLPRSGTTLIEHILSAHSRVQPTDELPFLERIALRLEMNGGYPRRLSALTNEEKTFLRQQYIVGAGAYLRQEGDYFIDKYPGNFLHVGLIKRIMPESIIIDARRDPRDIAISAYRQMFSSRGEFASSFDGIYEYYKGYRAMIQHWQSVYPNQIRTVNYEQLVSSPDEGIQALLDFCGLDSEPGCFRYYEQERAVTTPSAGQVSKPMYTSSIGQWRHYEEFVPEDMSRLGSSLDTDEKNS